MEQQQQQQIEQVIKTNDEASKCKYILNKLGYIKDEYIKSMINLDEIEQFKHSVLTSPIIIKGY